MVEIKTGLGFVRVASKWKRLVTEPSHKPDRERERVCVCVRVRVCACVRKRVAGQDRDREYIQEEKICEIELEKRD